MSDYKETQGMQALLEAQESLDRLESLDSQVLLGSVEHLEAPVPQVQRARQVQQLLQLQRGKKEFLVQQGPLDLLDK